MTFEQKVAEINEAHAASQATRSEASVDHVKLYMDKYYTQGARSRHAVKIQLEKFLNITILEAYIGSRHYKHHFLDGAPIFTYWMTKDQRRPWIAKMVREGYRGCKIAEMLQFSRSTIYNDIKYLKGTGSC